jgi:hypothetical protein
LFTRRTSLTELSTHHINIAEAAAFVVLVLLAVALAGCSPTARTTAGAAAPTPPPAASPTPMPAGLDVLQRQYGRSDDGAGGARSTVTWITADYLRLDPAAGQGFDPQKQLIFRVVVDAPGLNMSAWDLKGMLYLREEGGKEYGTPIWVPAAGNGTLSGVAAFPRLDSRDQPVPRLGARYIEVVIRDLRQVRERVFRWPLP